MELGRTEFTYLVQWRHLPWNDGVWSAWQDDVPVGTEDQAHAVLNVLQARNDRGHLKSSVEYRIVARQDTVVHIHAVNPERETT